MGERMDEEEGQRRGRWGAVAEPFAQVRDAAGNRPTEPCPHGADISLGKHQCLSSAPEMTLIIPQRIFPSVLK